MFDSNTLLGIVNASLVGIGERTIDALGDANDKLSVQAGMLIRQVILDIESAPCKPWKELYEVRELVLAEENKKCGEWYFNKPTDCLIPVEVIQSDMRNKFSFREEGRFIIVPVCELVGNKDVHLKYVRESFDPAEWGNELRGCVISLFSARMIGVCSSDPMKSANMENAFWNGEFRRRSENRILNTDAVEQYPRGIYNGVNN